jgi:hypothetical protein
MQCGYSSRLLVGKPKLPYVRFPPNRCGTQSRYQNSSKRKPAFLWVTALRFLSNCLESESQSRQYLPELGNTDRQAKRITSNRMSWLTPVPPPCVKFINDANGRTSKPAHGERGKCGHQQCESDHRRTENSDHWVE